MVVVWKGMGMIIYSVSKTIDEKATDTVYYTFSKEDADREMERWKAADPETEYLVCYEEVEPSEYEVVITENMSSEEIRDKLNEYYINGLLVNVDGEWITLYEAKKMGVDVSEFEEKLKRPS